MALSTLSTKVPWMCINCVSAVSLCCFFGPPPSTNTCRFYTLTSEISSGSLLPLAASATPLEGLYKTSLAPMETAITAFLCSLPLYCRPKKKSSFAALLHASFETSRRLLSRKIFRAVPSLQNLPLGSGPPLWDFELSPFHEHTRWVDSLGPDSKQGTFLSGDKEVETVCSSINGPCSKKKRNPEGIINSGAKVNIKQLLLSPRTNHRAQMNRKM